MSTPFRFGVHVFEDAPFIHVTLTDWHQVWSCCHPSRLNEVCSLSEQVAAHVSPLEVLQGIVWKHKQLRNISAAQLRGYQDLPYTSTGRGDRGMTLWVTIPRMYFMGVLA
ncbi:hypothetical protein XENOCAPTIV_003830 [Xenoophorus captivus]|uniref:Uncharacterized protein n=1 Tax=Xenoophorus captivus TaxID=1517983 RepID=A0ABV0QPR2_9TELE